MNERDFYTIKASAGADVADLWIYDRIGSSLWEEGVRAADLVRELAEITAPRISVHISSLGGSVWDGLAIHTALRDHPAHVTAYVDAVAASIASVIALAADRVVIAGNARMMIHNPAGGLDGTAAEHRSFADLLAQLETTLVRVYAGKTGREADEIRAAMAAETWYTAEEAVAFGLADEIAQPLAIAACFSAEDFTDLGFRHTPPDLTETTAAENGAFLPPSVRRRALLTAAALSR